MILVDNVKAGDEGHVFVCLRQSLGFILLALGSLREVAYWAYPGGIPCMKKIFPQVPNSAEVLRNHAIFAELACAFALGEGLSLVLNVGSSQ